MIPISRAIRIGTDPDPLKAALQPLGNDFSAASRESACDMAIRVLHTAWPHLGQTARSWPTLAVKLEKLKLLPPRIYGQVGYRREYHASLYHCVTALFDTLAWPKDDIATLLAEARL